jgi:hypothetical protein
MSAFSTYAAQHIARGQFCRLVTTPNSLEVYLQVGFVRKAKPMAVRVLLAEKQGGNGLKLSRAPQEELLVSQEFTEVVASILARMDRPLESLEVCPLKVSATPDARSLDTKIIIGEGDIFTIACGDSLEVA